MGGLLIKKFGFEPKRVSKQEFTTITTEMLFILNNQLPPNIKFRVIPYYRFKDSFGDSDWLITRSTDFDIRQFIIDTFNIVPYANAGVYSFPFKEFQFDFVTVPDDEYACAFSYYGWNDLGNLCGRSFHTVGLHHGHEGLYFWIREEHVGGERSDNSQLVNYLCLSKDPKEIMEFGGYDYSRYQKGFDTLEEVFQFACSGKWFHPDKFSYENLNHINRTRNRKRKTYQAYLEWLAINKDNYKWFDFNEDKFSYIPMIMDRFPILKETIIKERAEYQLKLQRQTKFNGDLIKEWTGITEGKELGKLISGFKKSFVSKEIMKNCLNKYDQDYIKKMFDIYYKTIT